MSNALVKVGNSTHNNCEELVINTGTKRYVVKDEHGRPMGDFFWNPLDSGIITRYNEVSEYFEGIDKKEGETVEQFVVRADAEIIQKMSYLLNEDTSQSLFSRVKPLSVLANGKSFCEEVLEKIAMLIERENDKRVRRAKTRVNKYTERYHK